MPNRRLYVALCVLTLGLLVAAALIAAPRESAARSAEAVPPGAATPGQATYRGVLPVAHFDISLPLRSIPAAPFDASAPRDFPDRGSLARGQAGAHIPDTAVQKLLGPLAIPTPLISFDGPGNLCGGCAPPDPNGEIGPNNIVVMDNLHFQIFNRSGTSLYGPVANNTLWAGFGGPCQVQNAGDPIVLYDQLADRWLLSQFTSTGPVWYNCVALSQTADPTGAYYRWAFSTGGNFPDYPKYGMWPDAYYISTREFVGSAGPFAGVGAYAANRAQMIAGNPNPTVLSFLASSSSFPAYDLGDGLLPADLDGAACRPPAARTTTRAPWTTGAATARRRMRLTLWKFTSNFANPPASSFVLANTLPTAPFDTVFEPCGGGRGCIPQPGTANRIDSLTSRQRPIFRLAYRNMGDHESLVTNQSVDAGAGPTERVVGVHWWELRSPNSSPVIFQEGTYAPGLTDGIDRWMGSIAMDQSGDMALGYSASSATTFPSVWYTGRLAGDPLGQMPQGEAAIVNGTGSQTSQQRWGDYTDMTVDPVDDCTFWYVNEYVPTTSASGWRLRIGAFKFGTCGAATPTPTATATATATATSTATRTPLPTATGTPCAITFSDVHPTDYFYTPVLYLACHGVVSGYADGTFRPYNQTTRSQMVKIVVLGFSVPAYSPPNTNTFADVPPANPFFGVVEAAAHANIVSGYACGSVPSEPCDAQNRPYFRPVRQPDARPALQDRGGRGGLARLSIRPVQSFAGRVPEHGVLHLRGDRLLPWHHQRLHLRWRR